MAFLGRVYAAQSQSNPLHPDLWPSATKFEAEIVAMTAAMLGGGHAAPEAPVVGTVSSGGTESILLAMKTYRDFARERRGIAAPEIVAPVTAHAAFDKAARFFDMPLVRVPVDGGFRADLGALAAAVTERTAVVVGSAPNFPHGVIDPIPEIAALAADRGVACHVDACLGGFILPWAERLGYPVPPFDFRLPGVTSMSADTHKYGYAAKGSSVVLYRGRELRQFQYYTVTDWPGGLYLSPTFAGSRPGALSATCWAAMVSIGESGYTEAARRILATGARIRDGIAAIPGLSVLGDPLWVIAFAADDGLDVYQVMENMGHRGWSLNGLQRPAAVHIAVTLRHTLPGSPTASSPTWPPRSRRSGPIPGSAPGWHRSTAWPPPWTPTSSTSCWPATSTCCSRCRRWPRHVLAIDLGTSALKVALVSTAGEVVASEQETHEVTLLPGGGAEQDPRHWWDLITKASSRLMARGAVAAGVGGRRSPAPPSGRGPWPSTPAASPSATRSSGWTRAARRTCGASPAAR